MLLKKVKGNTPFVIQKKGTSTVNAIGEKETTWVFEDAVYAAKTAKANGYNVVGIYDKSEPKQEELKEIVDIYINNYSELEIF